MAVYTEYLAICAAETCMTDYDYDPIPLDPLSRLSDAGMLKAATLHKDFVSRRRSVRDFSAEPIDRAVIEACVLAAGAVLGKCARGPLLAEVWAEFLGPHSRKFDGDVHSFGAARACAVAKTSWRSAPQQNAKPRPLQKFVCALQIRWVLLLLPHES